MSSCKNTVNIASAERDPVFLSQKGKAGGVATLDGGGHIPLSQLPLRDGVLALTEVDPVFLSQKGQPGGVAELDSDGFVIMLQLRVGLADGLAGLGSTGLVPRHQLGTGVADNTTFLRGDGTWQVVTSGGGSGGDTVWEQVGNDVFLITPANVVNIGDLLMDGSLNIKGPNGTTYIDMTDGSGNPVSAANHARTRYNNTSGNKGLEVSISGGPYQRIIADERDVERIAAMLDI